MSDFVNENNNNVNDNYGYTNRVYTLRTEKGLTQEQFAEMINVSKVLISDIERKKKILSLKNAIEIRKVFNVSLDWLYELTDDTNDTASNIIDNLKNVFQIDFSRRTISIDEDLGEFLTNLFVAYETKTDKNIPDEALKYWVDGLKKDYNEKLKQCNNQKKVSKKYYLQDYREHKLEHASTIMSHNNF